MGFLNQKIKKLLDSYIFVFKEVQKANKSLLSILIFSTLVLGLVPI
jgi:hypothetical protein